MQLLPSAPASAHLRSSHRHARSTPILRSSRSRFRPRSSVIAREPVPASSQAPADIVDSVLELVKDTDGGINMPEEKREQVDTLLEQLEVIGDTQSPRPLQNPLLWGNYEVVYTSTRRAPSERGQPSGGRFRGTLGRTLFRTTGLFQSVLEPGIVTNKVAWRLFGIIAGAVGLRGTVQPVGENGDTVKVIFEPPVLTFGPLHLKIGRDSDVQLKTTYIDERVRIGKGSRGSLFVFTRGGASDAADMDKVGLEKTSPLAVGVAAACTVALLLGGFGLWMMGHPLARAAAMGMWMVGACLGAVLRSGGLITDDRGMYNDKYDTEKQQQQQQQQQAAGGSGAAA